LQINLGLFAERDAFAEHHTVEAFLGVRARLFYSFFS